MRRLRQMIARLEARGLVVLAAVVVSLGPNVRPAAALSLYDVVQLTRAGYTDRQLIELIETTEARFVLDAGAVTALKEAGVSEAVLQALIRASAVAGDAGSAGAADPSGVGQSREIGGRRLQAPSARGGVSEEELRPGPRAPSSRTPSAFATFPYDEPGSGHDGLHQHFALTVAGVPVLVLRSEAGYPSVAARAQALVARLTRELRGPGGSFFSAPGSTPAVRYQRPSGGQVELLSVDHGDVVAYQRRSIGPLTAERLAAYWAALLDDYTRVLVYREAPTRLSGLHVGKVLATLYGDLTSGRAAGDSREPADLAAVLDHLSEEDKEHLIELVRRVPAEFGGGPS